MKTHLLDFDQRARSDRRLVAAISGQKMSLCLGQSAFPIFELHSAVASPLLGRRMLVAEGLASAGRALVVTDLTSSWAA